MLQLCVNTLRWSFLILWSKYWPNGTVLYFWTVKGLIFNYYCYPTVKISLNLNFNLLLLRFFSTNNYLMQCSRYLSEVTSTAVLHTQHGQVSLPPLKLRRHLPVNKTLINISTRTHWTNLGSEIMMFSESSHNYDLSLLYSGLK